MRKSDKIFVTQPSLPELAEFIPYLEEIWKSKILTNNGPFHQELEKKLAEYLEVPYVSLFANGTLALVTALQALRISGEVITTPYSFVATTNALWWNNLSPVFVDIEPTYCNIDPNKIESAISPNTSAILPVHVYGNPCNVDSIQEIADNYGLKVIYDAAHTFGNKLKGTSILNYGDLSILSFHATKTYNTMEGGAIISHDEKTKKRIDHLKNFGFSGETTVAAPGINSKMNEMQAALGLLQLKHHKENIEKRNKIADFYREELKNIIGLKLMAKHPEATADNFSYFPIFVDTDKYGISRDEVYDKLKEHNIFGRRYFYPLISQFPIYKGIDSAQPGKMPIAERITQQIICLPIYPELDLKAVRTIAKILKVNKH